MRLELLQDVVNRELDVTRLEARDEPDGDEVLSHRIDERPAELAVPAEPTQRPAHGVDDPPERPRNAPYLLHPERPDLRVVALEPEPLDRRAGEQALRPLGEHGHPCDDIGTWLEVRKRLAPTASSAIAGPRPDNPSFLDEEPGRRGLGQQRDAKGFGLVGEESSEL
jgi:hypothetical protein